MSETRGIRADSIAPHTHTRRQSIASPTQLLRVKKMKWGDTNNNGTERKFLAEQIISEAIEFQGYAYECALRSLCAIVCLCVCVSCEELWTQRTATTMPSSKSFFSLPFFLPTNGIYMHTLLAVRTLCNLIFPHLYGVYSVYNSFILICCEIRQPEYVEQEQIVPCGLVAIII